MRLPAITPRQILVENSRAQHECWFQAFLDGQRVVYPTTPAEYEKFRWSLTTNTRAFWAERGFKICTTVAKDHLTVTVWLVRRESMGQKEQAA